MRVADDAERDAAALCFGDEVTDAGAHLMVGECRVELFEHLAGFGDEERADGRRQVGDEEVADDFAVGHLARFEAAARGVLPMAEGRDPGIQRCAHRAPVDHVSGPGGALD
ncbi:hypothetical protein, partial [Microbacterium aurum]